MLKMDNSEIWKDCIGAISNLIEEADFEVDGKGIRMKAMDPSHVALVDFRLSSKAFSAYDVEDTVKLGLDLTEMDKVMSRAKKNDESAIGYIEEENRLKIEFKGTSTRRFSLPLLDLEDEDLPDPDLDFTASAKIAAGVINDGLKDAALVGDNVRFELLEGKFLMKIESDTGSAELELSEDDEALESIDVDNPSRAMYNIGYLEDMFKASSSNDIVEIKHGQDLPIQIIFEIAEGNGHLKFLLAPRVETE